MQILSKKYQDQYQTKSSKVEAAKEFQGIVRSSKRLLEVIEIVLNERLNKLIIEDEDAHKQINADYSYIVNKGKRQAIREFKQLLDMKTLEIGE